jgi:putative transcriptional regulator
MIVKQGYFLKSSPALASTVFEDTLVLIAEYNEKGALGFIINKAFGRNLNELEEFKQCKPFPIYKGGPVDQEHLYFVHQRPDIIEDGVPIEDGMYMGGNFTQAVAAINNRKITTADLKLFVGYCGWNKGELETEIEEGSWKVEEGLPEEVFINW